MTTIFLGCPNLGSVHPRSARAAYMAAEGHEVIVAESRSSILPHSFNTLWATALNYRASAGVTHFGMLHADVEPPMGWLDCLMGELEAHQADMVSALVAIKTRQGYTSTAVVRDGQTLWNPQKLTLREAQQLPETFGSLDVGGILLANTGCFVCRLDRSWAELVCFGFRTCLTCRESGGVTTYSAECVPEDWDFSRQLHDLGARVLVTRKLHIVHHGEGEYHSGGDTQPWGTL